MSGIKSFSTTTIALTLVALTPSAFGHGLVQSPPSRNWFCGAITKPDQVANGVAEFPVCGDAFAFDPIAGYSFMSVLTHTLGRSVVGPRSNVCGFNSETFGGGATVWDQPINWPTSNISAGPQTFTWNISWGPHFSDTAEFRYWITKPGFNFQVGKPLSFDDFEDTPFCVLPYDDANPSANPNVVPDKANALFQTHCTVPARSGRHVIYAEWGRNQFTFERFSSCMDVQFQGGPPIDAKIGLSPNVTEFTGAGTITLDGSTSVGAGLTYHWGVTAANQSLYTLTNADQRVATLALANPSAAESISISLVVSNSTSGSDVANLTLLHHPSQPSPWFDLGVLNNAARPLIAGNRISMRVVQNGGQDVFLPNVPLVVTAANAAANGWPFDLATAVNALGGNIRIGVLGAQNVVTPVRDATANRVFSVAGAGVTGAFLQVAPANATCRVNYALDTQWGNGYQASVTITNTAAIPVVGYTLTWAMATGEGFTSGWNATFTPSGQGIAAANTAGQWNGVLAPNGGTSSFGFIGSKGTAAAVIPTSFRLNGDPCATGQTASIVVPTNPASGIAGGAAMPVEHCNHVPYPGPQPARATTAAIRRGTRTRWSPLRRRRLYRSALQTRQG